jgi:hypothetical protein
VLLFRENDEPFEWAVLGDGTAGAGVWHTVLALCPDAVLFEVKRGPYRSTGENDFAPWSPLEGTPEARELLGNLGEVSAGRR